MKKRTSQTAAIVFAAAAVTLGSARGARADERIVTNVPFAFMVGDVRLPAGDYVVKDLSDGSGVLAIASADGREFTYTLTIPSTVTDREEQPELIFEKLGERYFLARVVPQRGDAREIILPRSAAEGNKAKAPERSSN